MKKAISLVLSLMLIWGLCAFPASAAGNGTITAADASGRQGDTVTVAIGLGSNPGLITFRVAVSYDSDLELVSVSDSGLLKGWTQPNPTISSPYTLRWADSLATTNNTANGKIATLTFKIKNTAAPGGKKVTVSFTESRDANGGKNTFADATANITVACASHTYGAYTKLNDNQHSRTCSACGHVETVNHSWNGGAVTKQATCKESGTKEYTCTACGAKKTETVAKTNSHSWGGYTVTKQPTCTAAGVQTRTCSVCGKTESQAVNATGHKFGAWAQSKAPTCTEKGEEKRSCSACGHAETRAINALGHSFSHPTVTKEPTCTETGVETRTCTVCEKTESQAVNATGHKFGAWADTKAATCTEGGTQERKCSACDATESRSTKALGHDFENPTVVKEATIGSTGLKEGKCKRCGETTSEIIPCTARDEATGTSFEAAEGAFSAGTELTVEKIQSDNPAFDSAKNVLKDVGKDFTLYDIAAILNGAAAQPNGAVTASFTIPDGYGTDVAVYFIAADGTAEKLESTVSEDGKTVSARLMQLGNYAVCKLDKAGTSMTDSGTATDGNATGTNANNEPTDSNSGSQTAVYILLAIVAVLVISGAVAAVVIVKKKRSR